MALYRFSAGVIARGRGHSSTAAAAYRAGERITDERTGQTHDYTRRTGVLWTGIYAPKDAPEWAQDRARLWNAVEQGEKRKDARTAREFIVCIPHELDVEQGRRLLGDFLRENFARKGFVADAAIHGPGRGGDERNVHAHFLVTTRQVERGRFVEKKDRTQNEKATLAGWRENWAKLANRHLERAGFPGTLDHRSYEDRGIDRTPGRHAGKAAWNMERRGVPTEAAELEKAGEDRRREIAEIKAELARLEAAPEAPRPSPRPSDDPGRSEGRPASRNAAERTPEVAPTILKVEAPPGPDPARRVRLESVPERPPIPAPAPPPPPTVERKRPEPVPPPPAVLKTPPKVENEPAKATKSSQPKDLAKPRGVRLTKPVEAQARPGVRALFAAAAEWARSVFGNARGGRDEESEEVRSQTPPPADPRPVAAAPQFTKPPASALPERLQALTPAGRAEQPKPPPAPYRVSKAAMLAEQEARRVRQANKHGHGL